MSATNLPQDEADALLQMDKHKVADTLYRFPDAGGSLRVPLQSANQREQFSLDITRGRIDLRKVTYQNRTHQIVILARLDIHGPPHRNPDGQEVPCPHLHVYREGYGDKWAYPPDPELFPHLDDRFNLLADFLRYINVSDPPQIDRGLFR